MNRAMDIDVGNDTSLRLLDMEQHPDDKLVQATQGAMTASIDQDFDNITDLDLANIVYINRIPAAPEGDKQVLDNLVQEILLWEAFELTKTEQALNDKVKDKALPDDQLMESKARRMKYRSKVIEHIRQNSPWLGQISFDTQTLQVSTTGKQLNLDISHTLLSMNPNPNAPDLGLLLKAIGPSFGANNPMIQPFTFTLVDFVYDKISQQFRAETSFLTFEVKIVQDAPKSKEPQISASITYIENQSSFNMDIWKQSEPTEDMVKLGKGLLQFRSINSVMF